MKLIFYVALVFLLSGNLFAQSDSAVFVVPEMNIYQMKKGKEVIYEFDQHKNFLYLNGDTIKVSTEKYKYAVDISAVNKISLRNGSKTWQMAGYAALGAFATGFIIGSLSKISVTGDGPGERNPLFGFAFRHYTCCADWFYRRYYGCFNAGLF